MKKCLAKELHKKILILCYDIDCTINQLILGFGFYKTWALWFMQEFPNFG